MGADINGDGLIYDRNESAESSGVESSGVENSNTDNGGTENE